MGLLDVLKNNVQEVNKVEETQSPVAPEESAKETQVATLNRSAYNCPDCKGEGLLDSNTRCVSCGGTGKLNPQTAQYPEGTVVLKSDGQYRMSNGQLVKE